MNFFPPRTGSVDVASTLWGVPSVFKTPIEWSVGDNAVVG